MSERATYNMRKTEILQFVSENIFVEPLEVSIWLGISTTNASTKMGVFYRRGLLSRQKTSGKIFGYSITDRGLDRLNWLLAPEEEEE